MLINYIKSAFRNLRRHKLFFGLNILGLVVGMSGSILIFLWVQDEMSYDRFNTGADRIFRLISKGDNVEFATSPFGFGPVLPRELTEVETATRFLPADQKVLSYGDRRFIEKRIGYTDSNFLKVFSYPLLKGSALKALSLKDGIVLTERSAKKYFGNEDPMGKMIRMNDRQSYVVTGVLKDPPRNSHLQFDFLMSLPAEVSEWNNYIYFTYVKVYQRTADDPDAVHRMEQKISAVFRKQQTGVKIDFLLQRLTDIHLRSHILMDVPGQGNIQYVRVLSWVAFFILLIACVNFVNLSTAISGTRAKEVGLRKTIGALRYQLIVQFLGESFLLSFIAMLLGVGLTGILLPMFNELTGKQIGMQFFSVYRILGLVGVAAAVGVLAGIYPAIAMSAFQPVKVLKGLKVLHPGRAYLRNGLVMFQFAISIVLIVGTVVVYQQLQFINHRDIGYQKEDLLYIQIPQVGDMQKSAGVIDQELSKYPGIVNHTVVSDLPTDLTSGDVDVRWSGKDPEQQTEFSLLGGDDNFIATFGMHLIAGRYFSKAFPEDRHNFVVNEASLKVMGLTPASAIGKRITYSGQEGSIIGVLKDFNFKPVHRPVDPLLLMKGWTRGYLYEVVRTTPATLEKVLPLVQQTFSAVYGKYPFSYGFVDQDLSMLYATDQRMGRLIAVFSVLSIIVSCLGLFGLSAYTTHQRFKEIGVRKVLGASVPAIVRLLARQFLVPVVLAALVAFPLAYWAMAHWLSAFAYRISIQWWVFAVAWMGALIIALITVGFQATKAALANPVVSLRIE